MSDAINLPEEWRPVVGYEGYYEVSDEGRVRSVTRTVANHSGFTKTVKGRPLKLKWIGAAKGHKNARLAVTLNRDGVSKNFKVHLLVLTAFVKPRPLGLVGCHNDDNPEHNQLSNLRWDTQSENVLDIVRRGAHHLASRPGCARGHLFIAPNLHPRPRGRGGCRACATAHSVVAQARARGLELDMQAVADEQYARIMRGEMDGPQTRCKRGHGFIEGNVVTAARGRNCRACKNTFKYNDFYHLTMTEAEFQAAADQRYRKYTGEEPQSGAATAGIPGVAGA